MLRETHKLFVLLTLMGLWLFPSILLALISVSEGNEPITNKGWPTGSEEVANLPSRLGYMVGPPFGGGECHFVYNCKDTAEFNNALQKFGAIRAPRMSRRSVISLDGQRTWIMDDRPLLLVVHDWVKEPWPERHNKDTAQDKKRVDWTFTIWVPENFHNLFSGRKGSFVSDHPLFHQPVPPPRIDVYLGGDSPIVWKEIGVPSNVRVIDTRAEVSPVNVDDGGVIRGGVFDMATHQVIVGADVILVKRTEPRNWKETTRTKTDKGGNKIGSWGGSMQCKKDGSFEFKGVPPGEYIVIAKPNPMREGEASPPKLVTITVGKTVELEIVSNYAHNSK